MFANSLLVPHIFLQLQNKSKCKIEEIQILIIWHIALNNVRQQLIVFFQNNIYYSLLIHYLFKS